MENLKEVFLKEDIFPLGKFETLPVTSIYGGEAHHYPDVVKLSDNIDFKTLLQEAYNHMKITGATYVKDRMNYLPTNIDEQALRSILGDVGFVKGSYQSFSLRKLGTADLEDWVSPATRELIDNLGVKTFRQQYAVAYGGWNVKLHRDHANFLTHGFRIMVPISSNVYMGYEDANGNSLVYKLEPGGTYFVNIAKMHRGFNESLTDSRINLIMQMDSDILLKDKQPMDPLPSEELVGLPDYAFKYDIWEFGHEL